MLKMAVTHRGDWLRAEKGGVGGGHSLALSALVLLLTTVDFKDGCRAIDSGSVFLRSCCDSQRKNADRQVSGWCLRNKH